MKDINEVKQNAEERNIAKGQKLNSCCGPTCCGGSNDKTITKRKEKLSGKSR